LFLRAHLPDDQLAGLDLPSHVRELDLSPCFALLADRLHPPGAFECVADFLRVMNPPFCPCL
jgi:hypothetical protein